MGILCKDGVVIAADKQTTHGSMGAMTVGHSTTKIAILKDRALLASAGHRGLGQQFNAALDPLIDSFPRKRVAECANDTQKKYRELVVPAFQTAQAAAAIIGNSAAQGDVICHSILATECLGGIKLIEITPQAGVEVLNSDLPYICLGSGKQNADPFLGFLWQVYFPSKKEPSLLEGALLAYWTVTTAINLASAGVGFGADVFVVREKGTPKAVQLTDDDLRGHQEFIGEAESALRAIQTTMLSATGSEPPVRN